MMNFEEFLCYVEEHILKGWKENAEVRIQETKKNNGITYQGLSIREMEEMVAPCIYLEEFHDLYQRSGDLEEVMEKIRQEYQWAMERSALYEMNVLQYDRIRKKIIFRLVNYEKNREILEDCPCIQMHDLALTFRWVAHTDSIGISTALITNRELALWGISLHELLLVARENTRRLFPPRIMDMDSFLVESGRGKPPLMPGKIMYIMTNEQQINGATVLVYDGVLRQFADKIKEDFYVLPSSIHELILVPASQFADAGRLFEMVREANDTIVLPVDYLSDSVYYYNRRKDQLTLAASDA